GDDRSREEGAVRLGGSHVERARSCGLDRAGDLHAGLDADAIVEAIIAEEVEHMLRNARIGELLVRLPHRQHGGTVEVKPRLGREIVEARRRLEDGPDEGIAGGQEKMRLWLIVELRFPAADMGE